MAVSLPALRPRPLASSPPRMRSARPTHHRHHHHHHHHHHRRHLNRRAGRPRAGGERDEAEKQRDDAPPAPQSPPSPAPEARRKAPKRQADSTDWVASALTRRFGLAGGLAWLGVLTFGVVSEQVKTRREVAEEERNVREVTSLKEVTKADGLKYTDLKIGGGSFPVKGYLTVVDFKVTAGGTTLFDTKARGKPYVFIYGARPFTGGICEGVEEGLADMRTGGRRLLVVPPELGFGSSRQAIGDNVVPPDSELEYDITLQRISIPPS